MIKFRSGDSGGFTFDLDFDMGVHDNASHATAI